MKKRTCNTLLRFAMSVFVVMIAWAMAPGARSWAGELAPIPLPPPQTDGGKPLMQALGLRATSRAFAPEPIPAQTLSNLMWAAWGINRPADGKRTAPSARNWQEIDLMVVRADGTFLYDAAANRLRPVAAGALVHVGRIMQDFTADELTFGSAYTIGREMDEILGIDSPALSMAVRWMER